MLNYLSTTISVQEVPGEISMIFEISGCPHRCEGCHSMELWSNSGRVLNLESLSYEIEKYKKFITCVCFFGGEWSEAILASLLKECRQRGYKTCLYTGAQDVSSKLKSNLDFSKTGRWEESLGGLNSLTTNQRFIHLGTGECLNFLFQNNTQGEGHVKTKSGTDF